MCRCEAICVFPVHIISDRHMFKRMYNGSSVMYNGTSVPLDVQLRKENEEHVQIS